jgi:hypothetical protein
MGAKFWIFGSVADVNNNESRLAIIGLGSDDPAHPLNHLPSTSTRSDNNANIGLGYVDTFVQNFWSR